MYEPKDYSAIIREYKENNDINVRNEIILHYIDLVRLIALSLRNTFSKYADLDDIVNEGVIALINALDTFDIGRGVKFETYANLKIKGAIIDYVRKQDWVPRQVRHFSRELDAAYNHLFNELGRYPTNQELADYMGLTKEKLAKSMADAAGTITLSFEELMYEDNFNVAGSDAPDADMYATELKQIIAAAIAELKPKSRQVVTLYYYEKLKFNEIAKILGVTESRVCQIHSKAMLLLKRELEEYLKR